MVFALTFLASPDALAVRNGCVGECQELFRDISFGSPLIGLFYLISPVFGLVLFLGKKAKTRQSKQDVNTGKLGAIFYTLARAAFLLILVVEYART